MADTFNGQILENAGVLKPIIQQDHIRPGLCRPPASRDPVLGHPRGQVPDRAVDQGLGGGELDGGHQLAFAKG